MPLSEAAGLYELLGQAMKRSHPEQLAKCAASIILYTYVSSLVTRLVLEPGTYCVRMRRILM